MGRSILISSLLHVCKVESALHSCKTDSSGQENFTNRENTNLSLTKQFINLWQHLLIVNHPTKCHFLLKSTWKTLWTRWRLRGCIQLITSCKNHKRCVLGCSSCVQLTPAKGQHYTLLTAQTTVSLDEGHSALITQHSIFDNCQSF